MSRRGLDASVLDWIAAGATAPADDERFQALALELFRYQQAHNPAYRRLCDAFGVEASEVGHWREIPPVPTGAFKQARLACFPEADEVRAFRSSGTTTGRPGVLHLDTLALYEASLLATFGAYVCPDVEEIDFAVLEASSESAPHSSLAWMFEIAARRWGRRTQFLVGDDGWDPARAIRALERSHEPLAVVGTAFAFVHLLDSLAAGDARLELPPKCRVMETGGFKGRGREVRREALHDAISQRLGVPHQRIVNQYGMSELASQFYEPTLAIGVPSQVKQVPPWVRTRVVDPDTLRDVPPGERGVLIHYDLANTGSVLAVQTSDVGRIAAGGFEVLGRLEGAEAKGCSIAADALGSGV